MSKQPKITSVKKWTVELISYEDGSSKIKRMNKGFSSLELLGMISHAQAEILKQMSGEIKPTVVERNAHSRTFTSR